MVMALDYGAKAPGFKSLVGILFLSKFSKKKRKKQRNKMLRQILLLEEKENKDKCSNQYLQAGLPVPNTLTYSKNYISI